MKSCRASTCGARRGTIRTCASSPRTSGGRKFCFWSDLVPTVNHTQPDLGRGLRSGPGEAIDQRRAGSGAPPTRVDLRLRARPLGGMARIERDEKRQFRAVAL